MAETVDKNRTTVPSSVGSESTRFNLIYLLVVVFAVRIVWEFVAFHKNAATPLLATMRASLGWNNEDLIGAADSVNANSMNSSLLPAAANNNDSISSSSSSSSTTQKTTVAYAVTVTKFSSGKSTDKNTLFDRAAILHQSIKSAMKLSSRYDYHIYAFVHPDAIEVKPLLESLGYRVQIRDTPFNITHIQNQNLIDAQGNGCCGEKVRAEQQTIAQEGGNRGWIQVFSVLFATFFFLTSVTRATCAMLLLFSLYIYLYYGINRY
jgi:hypothetical protein